MYLSFQDIADIRNRMDQENSERTAEDKALNDRLDKEIRDREEACNQLQARYQMTIVLAQRFITKHI